MSKRLRSCSEEEDDDSLCPRKYARVDPARVDSASWGLFLYEDGGCFRDFFTRTLDPVSQRALCCVDKAHYSRLMPMRRNSFPSHENTRYIKYIEKANLYSRLSDAVVYDHAGAFTSAWNHSRGYRNLRKSILYDILDRDAYQCATTFLVNASEILMGKQLGKNFTMKMLPHIPIASLPDWIMHCLPRLHLKWIILDALSAPMMPTMREFMQALLKFGCPGLTDRIKFAIQAWLANNPSTEADEYELIEAAEELESRESSSSSEESSD